jgi:hypothetical protein
MPAAAARSAVSLRLAAFDFDAERLSPQSVLRVAPADPRWVFAVRVASMLDGGTAAILTPDRRRSLMAFAEGLRLRAFDASLIIAIVQDSARHGDGALSPTVESRLSFLAPAPAAASANREWMLLGVSIVLAGLMFLGLAAWLAG